MMVQYKGGNEYLWNYLRGQTQAPVCQRLPADPVDQQVVAAFFDAVAPAELDLYDHALAQRRQQRQAVDQAQQYALQRLEYEADRARQRYAQVAPAYRLVAAELERRWEAALQALQEAQAQYTRARQAPEADLRMARSPALRETCNTGGQALPTLWPQDPVSRAQRKALRRGRREKVGLERQVPRPSPPALGGVVARSVSWPGRAPWARCAMSRALPRWQRRDCVWRHRATPMRPSPSA